MVKPAATPLPRPSGTASRNAKNKIADDQIFPAVVLEKTSRLQIAG